MGVRQRKRLSSPKCKALASVASMSMLHTTLYMSQQPGLSVSSGRSRWDMFNGVPQVVPCAA